MRFVPDKPNVPATWQPRDARSRDGHWASGPLLVGSCLATLFFAAFAWLTHGVIYRHAWNEYDRNWALEMRQCGESRPTLRNVLIGATMLGGIRAMVALAIASALWQVLQQRRWLSLGIVLVALGGGLFDLVLKETLDRERPPAEWRDPFVKETNESFPSGHAMGSLIGYGLFCYVLTLQRIPYGWKIAAILAAFSLVLTVGFSRIYLRAHWFSDVVGGYLIGAGWLALGLGLLETKRRHPNPADSGNL